MNICYRQKDGNLQAIISYKQGGKWRQKSRQGFKTKREATAWAEKASLSILEDKADGISQNDMTLKTLFEIVVEMKRRQTRKPTVMLYESVLRNMGEELLSKRVRDISPYDITSYFLDLRERTGGSYSDAMTKLKTVFNVAVNDLKIIRSNPVKVLKSTSEDKRTLYITKELFNKLIAGANKKQRLILNILYYTGMRYSEAMAITLPNVTKDSIKVEYQINRETNDFAPLKTENSKREIPTPEWLIGEIKAVKTVSVTGRIFPKYHRIGKFLKPYNVSPHCFRHTYATNLVHKGVNLKVAADILGDTFETFCKTYVQSSEDLMKQERAKILADF